jgi:hypothetical protein
MKLDPAYQPSDPPDTEFDGEKTLKWVRDSFTCEQVYGDEVYEKPSLDFLYWYNHSNWVEVGGGTYRNWEDYNRVIDGTQLYQEYLNSKE